MRSGHILQSTLLRFLAVGGALALFYAILAALATSHLPMPKALSAALVGAACVPLGFWAHRRFTFVTRKPHRHGLWLYSATQVLGLGIAAITSHLLATGMFRPDLLVHLLASTLAALASYLVNRLFVFPHSAAD